LAGLAAACLGHAFDGLGQYPAAVDALETALATCDDDQLIDQIRAFRAHLLANSPRAAEVVDELVEVVAGLVASGDEQAAATAQFDLAIAYHVAGELLDAAEIAETAVRALGAAGRHVLADRCRYRLSKIYVDLGEGDQALAVLDELIGRLDGFDNLGARGQIHEDAGQILFQLDRDAAAVERFAAAEECFQSAGQPHDAARVLRAQAVAASWTDDPAMGLAMLERADQFALGLPEGHEATTYERGMLDVDGARVLANIDRPSQAVSRLVGAAGRLRAIGAWSEALDAELLHARLLLGLGDLQNGEAMLRSVIASSPRDSGLHRSAVWTLIAVLDETGRRSDANALRETYDLPDYTDSDGDSD
jgi:cellulose synthase operon protein C